MIFRRHLRMLKHLNHSIFPDLIGILIEFISPLDNSPLCTRQDIRKNFAFRLTMFISHIS